MEKVISYHLPSGHLDEGIRVLTFIKHPHSLHCLVGLKSLSQSKQIDKR